MESNLRVADRPAVSGAPFSVARAFQPEHSAVRF